MSVVFVDLVGFTAWSESQDAEDARELLSGYFGAARTVVGRFGGVVEKFIGDAVMAVWGAPVAREDDAERAVRAALDLVEAVPGLGEELGAPGLQARAGVVTGQVMSWANPGEGLVVGDRVNTAARVQSAAAPGTVWVDEMTRQVTQAAVGYSHAGTHAVKGKAEALHLWRAERVLAEVGGTQRFDGLETVFIGRGRELSVVKELFHASWEEGRARLVSVLGAAGVGKSRLGWEFEKYVDGLGATVWWHRGRCLSYGAGVGFWALTEMIRQRFGIAESDPPELAAAKLDAALPQWVPDERERAFLSPRIAVLVGASQTTGRQTGAGPDGFGREDLFAGWRLFLERLAQPRPVVLLIENLQWADAGLLDFLDYLLEWSQDSALFILTLSRPELSETRPNWPGRHRESMSLHLAPLPDPQLAELLKGLVPNLSGPLGAQIIARAQGVPLYAVELVRSLLDRGLITVQDGAYTVVGEVGELDVPAGLTSLISARLDALPPAERSLVKDLAVLGDSFPAASITAISTAPEQQTAALLRTLVAKEILTARSDPLSPDCGQYTFVQTLLRSVAHGMLTKRERRTRHLTVARHLQATYPNQGEEVAEVIAAHYLTAYQAAPPDEQESLRPQTVRALAAAGGRAGQVGSPDTAEGLYRQAADLSTDDQQQAELLGSAANMAYQAGRTRDALTLYETAANAHTTAGRHRAAAALAARIGRCQAYTGNTELAMTGMRAALDILSTGPPNAQHAELHVYLGLALLNAGRGAEGLPHIKRAMALAQQLHLPETLSRAHLGEALWLSASGQIGDALAAYGAAIEVAREANLIRSEMVARGNLALLRGDFDLPGAMDDHEVALALAKRIGDRDAEGLALSNLAGLHLWLGDWDATREQAVRALETFPEGGASASRLAPHSILLFLFAMRGQRGETRQQLAILATLGDSDDLADQAGVLIARAMTFAAEGEHQKSLDLAAEATALTHRIGGLVNGFFRQVWPLALESAIALKHYAQARDLLTLVSAAQPDTVPPYLRAQLLRCLALLGAQTGGRAEEIESGLRSALGIFTDLGYPYWQARTELDIGSWFINTGRSQEAVTTLREALATFEQIGAQPQIDKVAELLAAAGPTGSAARRHGEPGL